MADGQGETAGQGFEVGEATLARVAPALGARLAGLGLATRTVEHPAVFTVEESRSLRGDLPGAHTKNLFLRDRKGRLFLVVALEETAVDLRTFHTRVGAQGKVSFASPEAMGEVLDVEPGSVTAFAILNDRDGRATLVLDRALLAHDILHCHPLTNRATTAIARVDLLAFFQALGRDPLVVSLEAEDGDNAANGTSS